MRLFIAINLSNAMKDALIQAQKDMQSHGIRGNFTKEENLHLTLAFIGEYPDPLYVMDTLGKVSFVPFALSLQGIGCFKDLWWAGLKESSPLEDVVRQVRKALGKADIPFDKKRFSPHITLVRRATGEMPQIELEKAEMTVKSISLMRSDRGVNGIEYTEIGIMEPYFP